MHHRAGALVLGSAFSVLTAAGDRGGRASTTSSPGAGLECVVRSGVRRPASGRHLPVEVASNQIAISRGTGAQRWSEPAIEYIAVLSMCCWHAPPSLNASVAPDRKSV